MYRLMKQSQFITPQANETVSVYYIWIISKNMEESSACKGVASIATNQWGTEISMKNTEVLEAMNNSLGYLIIMKSTKVQNPQHILHIKPIMHIYWPRLAV